jgi:hypothetical protein
MRKIALIIVILFTSFSCSNDEENLSADQSITFNWDTAPIEDGSGVVTETIDGITVTVSASSSVGHFRLSDTDGSIGNVVLSYHKETSITFSFNKPVMVTSILALAKPNLPIEFTFTPSDDSNSVVKQVLIIGENVSYATVILNWTLVSSFTVSSTETLYGFDHLVVVDPSAL